MGEFQGRQADDLDRRFGLKVLGIIAEVRYNGNFGGDTKIVDGVSINSQPTSWNMSVGVMF